MILMNPYYAHPSSVGPVFDVADWSPRKIMITALLGLALALCLALCGLYFWNPKLFADYLPKFFGQIATEVLRQHRKYVWSKYAGAAGLAFLAYLFLAGGISCIGDVLSGNYYFRAGPGGLCIRVPDGLDLT